VLNPIQFCMLTALQDLFKCHSGQKCCNEELAKKLFVDGVNALAYCWENGISFDEVCAEWILMYAGVVFVV